MSAENGLKPADAQRREMLRRWVRHAFAQGWVCIRSRVSGSGHVAVDEHAKSPARPTEDECLAWVDQGGNVEVLLHESKLCQVDAENGASAPWGDPAAHPTVISASASDGLHAVYQNGGELRHHRWIKKVAPRVDVLTKGVLPLPGCRRDGTASKPPGAWRELAEPCAPAPLPEWVIAAVLAVDAGPLPRARVSGRAPRGYAEKARKKETALLAAVPEGSVNDALARSAFRMGQLEELDRDETIEMLVTACVRSNFDERRTRSTATRCFEAGRSHPRGPTRQPDVEIQLVNGAAAEQAKAAIAVTPAAAAPAPAAPSETSCEAAPSPQQAPAPAEPKSPEAVAIATLDDALALLPRAKKNVALLFEHADDLANLSRADEALFLQHAKKALKKKLAKTDLARAIQDRRKAKEKESRKAGAQRAREQRAERRKKAEEGLRLSAETTRRREIPLDDEEGLARDPLTIHADAVAALVAHNEPERLFLRAGRPARIGVDEEGQPVIEQVRDKEIQSELIRSAVFIGRDRSGMPQPVDPPLATIRTLLGCGDLPFPRLAGIVQAPVLRRDGSILMRAGYDKLTGLYYQADSGLVIPLVASAPSAEEVRKARELVLEIFSQFPYVSEASRANSLALLLTPFVQPVVDDNRPLCAITAYQPGAGKGEIAGACSRVSTGRPPRMTRLRREEELEKKLAQIMFSGAPFVCIDNAKGRLESETLESLLTSRCFGDRLLGHNNRGFEAPQDATWCATGNNLELGSEMTRRSYLVELDPKDPHAEDREGPRPGEKFKRLPSWVMEHRGRLIWAVLTLCRAWFAAGCPKPDLRTFGSFERWQEVVGGVLDVAGIRHFLGNRSRLRTEQDEEGNQWALFLREIRSGVPQPFTAKALANGLSRHGALADSVPDELAPALGRDDLVQRIGSEFRKKRGRRFGADGLRVVRGEDDAHEKVAQWRVVVGDEEVADAQ